MDTEDQLPPLLHPSNSAFAHRTIQERWPVIIAQTIDSLYRHRSEFKMKGVDLEKLKTLTGHFGQLRYEVMTDKAITLLSNKVNQSVSDDLQQWNALLQSNGVCLTNAECKSIEDIKRPSWYTLPWLLMECYLYRRMADLVIASDLGDLDPFTFKKREGFSRSVAMVQHLLSFMSGCVTIDSDHLASWFKTAIQAALWANEFDLSLHVDESHSTGDVTGNLRDHVQDMSDRLVVDDSDSLFRMWTERAGEANAKSKIHTTAILLDNSGPELLGDLCLAEFLLHHKLSSRVYFYPKCIPWFVSDVIPADIDWMLDNALHTQPFGKDLHIFWAKRFQERFASGQFIIKLSNFWTLPSAYCDLQSIDPALYEELSEMNVVVFKGDLHYRKLLADRQWTPDSADHKVKAFSPLQFGRSIPTTEPKAVTCQCSSSLGDPMDCRCFSANGSSPGPILVALRVAKADVAVGLSTSMLQRVVAYSKDWWVIGRYGFVQIVSPIKLT